MNNETPVMYSTNWIGAVWKPPGDWSTGYAHVVIQPENTSYRWEPHSGGKLKQIIGVEEEVKKVLKTETNRRIAQVFIVDPDVNVPLSDGILYKGEPLFTDLTDTELFFEVSIKNILREHNLKRVKWLDKDATKTAGRDVFLEQAKIRDLKMVVVNIATF